MSSPSEDILRPIRDSGFGADPGPDPLIADVGEHGSNVPPAREPLRVQRFGEGAVSGASLVIASRAVGLAISFGAIAVVARLLTPNDYGLVAMVLSVTAFFLVFSDLGLSLVTVQRPTITDEQLSALFWVNMGFGLLLGVVTVALAPVLVWFYREPRLLTATIVSASVFPLAAIGIQHQALLKRAMRFPRLASVRLSGTAGGAIVSVVGAYLGWGYWALVWQTVTTAVMQSVVSLLLVRWCPSRPRRCPELRSMLTFGGYLTAHGIVGWIAGNLDKILLGRFSGTFALGLYATSHALMGRGIALAAHSAGEAAIPAMSRSAESQTRMRGTYRRTLSLTCLLSFPIFAVGTLWADDVVLTMLGGQWVGAIPILKVFCLAAVARSLFVTMGWVFVATGRPGGMLQWELIWSPFLVAAFLAGLRFGAIGVAVGFAVAHWIALVPGFAYCFHGTEFRMTDYLRPAVAPLLCALGACAAVAAVQSMLLPGMHAGSGRLALRLGLLGAAYGVLAAMFVPLAHEALRRVRELLAQLVRRVVSRERRIACRGEGVAK